MFLLWEIINKEKDSRFSSVILFSLFFLYRWKIKLIKDKINKWGSFVWEFHLNYTLGWNDIFEKYQKNNNGPRSHFPEFPLNWLCNVLLHNELCCDCSMHFFLQFWCFQSLLSKIFDTKKINYPKILLHPTTYYIIFDIEFVMDFLPFFLVRFYYLIFRFELLLSESRTMPLHLVLWYVNLFLE
jgi:hypothetical protein